MIMNCFCVLFMFLVDKYLGRILILIKIKLLGVVKFKLFFWFVVIFLLCRMKELDMGC